MIQVSEGTGMWRQAGMRHFEAQMVGSAWRTIGLARVHVL